MKFSSTSASMALLPRPDANKGYPDPVGGGYAVFLGRQLRKGGQSRRGQRGFLKKTAARERGFVDMRGEVGLGR